jgi:hypothetical protein
MHHGDVPSNDSIDAAKSLDEARARVDMNGDFQNDYQDFVMFCGAFNAAQGAGSLASSIMIPEPDGVTLAVSMVGVVWVQLAGA